VVTNLITGFVSFYGNMLFMSILLLGFLHHVAVSCVAEVLEVHGTSINWTMGLRDQLHLYPEYILFPHTLTMKMET